MELRTELRSTGSDLAAAAAPPVGFAASIAATDVAIPLALVFAFATFNFGVFLLFLVVTTIFQLSINSLVVALLLTFNFYIMVVIGDESRFVAK
mmetsp:Transcript_63811/g.72218  ORF Transcript_63811/g.72218 Transcript_63811/m.72218 type:complete len:94 (+) Transcript_63811:1439-1720(+)